MMKGYHKILSNTPEEKTAEISFGKFAYLNPYIKNNEFTVELSLTKRPKGVEFSCSGDIWNSRHTDIIEGGQCLDEMLPYLKNDKLFIEIHSLWKQYHLNGLRAGTIKQEECLAEFKEEQKAIADEINKDKRDFEKVSENDYRVSCKLLENHNLLIDTYDGEPYKYGSKWLFREIPEKALKRIEEIINGVPFKEKIQGEER